MKSNHSLWRRFRDGLELIISSYKSRKGIPDAWETTIQKFESDDHLHPPEKNSILFIGTSSFTFWSTLEQDMAPLPIINRGFGGSHMRDMVQYLDRIVVPYQPRAVVLFAGANDIVEENHDLSVQVYTGFQEFVTRVRSALPEVFIYFVAITPVPTRWKYWPIIEEANQLIKEYTENVFRVGYIDFTQQLISEDGKPDRSLFKFDGIHPNQKCYALWTKAIKTQIEADISFV